MRRLAVILSFVATTVFAADTPGNGIAAGDLMIQGVMAAASFGKAKAGAGYLTVTNQGTTDDRLLAIEADFPRVEIHTTEMKDGVATMMHQEAGIEIPAGAMVRLAPGGLHVMFMGLKTPFVKGESFSATLVFQNAGRVAVTFQIVDRAKLGDMVMDHIKDAGNG